MLKYLLIFDEAYVHLKKASGLDSTPLLSELVLRPAARGVADFGPSLWEQLDPPLPACDDIMYWPFQNNFKKLH